MKTKKIDDLVLKIDLVKAYDKVEWSLLCLLLLNVGLNFEIPRWILACVSSTNFIVLVNGTPSSFFKYSRGLCQGVSSVPIFISLGHRRVEKDDCILRKGGVYKKHEGSYHNQ